MRLLRHGPKGQENPGLLDADGKVRSLEGIVADIDGTCLGRDGLAWLRDLDPVARCRQKIPSGCVSSAPRRPKRARARERIFALHAGLVYALVGLSDRRTASQGAPSSLETEAIREVPVKRRK
jgi:hypothetical protein